MANLTAAFRKTLQARSADELAQLADSWVVDEVPVDGWPMKVELLGEKMLEMISARFAWEGLSKNARDVLHQAILFEVMDGVPCQDLLALTALPEVDFNTALAELKQRLMLVEERPNSEVKARMETRGQQDSRVLVVPKEFRDLFVKVNAEIYTPKGDRTQLKLVDLLATCGTQKLQAMAMLYDMSSYYFMYSGTGVAPSLAGKLVQSAALELVWEKLDPLAQKLCRWLCRADGIAEMSQIRAALTLSNPALGKCLRQLESYGLVFDTFSGQERKAFIGRGVFKVLRKVIGELDEIMEKKQQAPAPVILQEAPPIVHEAHGQLLYDLAIIVGVTYQQVIEPTQAGKVPKRLANKIFPLLHGSRPAYYENEDRYLDMVFYIAQHLGLLRLVENTGQKARYMPGPKLTAWSRMQPHEQVRLLLDLWWDASNNFWSDVAGVHYRPDNFGYYMEMRAARKALLEYIAQECQPGQWYTLESFLQTIKDRNPLLLRSSTRYSPYGGTAQTRKTVLTNWEHGDSQIIAGMLASSLHELGLVTTGYQPVSSMEERAENNPYAFKLTELAAAVFGPIESADPVESRRTLIVQPNFELLLLHTDFPTLYQLLPFARVDQVEMVSRLTLTQESVRRGVEAGWGVERSLQILREHSQKDLPQNVLYTLQDWGRFYKDATLSQVLLLEVSSEAVADEICASAKFRTLELRRLGPCAIVVGGQVSLQVLRSTLEKEGVIVRVLGDILNAREYASTSSSTYYGRSR